MARLIGIAVAVDDRDLAVVMLLGNQSAGIHAEGAHLVFKGVGIIDQLGLVQVFGQVIHHGIGNLDAHADVHLVVEGGDARAGSRHDVFRRDLLGLAALLFEDRTGDGAVFGEYIFAGGELLKGEVVALTQLAVHCAQHVEGILGAHVAHRAGDELNVVLAGLVFELINLGVVEAVHQIGRAEGEILVVAIFDQIAHRLSRQIVG